MLWVFSTSVEVFPPSSLLIWLPIGLLHVRGGVSKNGDLLDTFNESSPRPWRCFHESATEQVSIKVFSTSVEVFLSMEKIIASSVCLLHVRGGVSDSSIVPASWVWSSPRPWRCFRIFLVHSTLSWVFSTSVEVFPRTTPSLATSIRLLHVRGGVSIGSITRKAMPLSSPRPWRCLNISVPGVIVVYSRELNGANCS